MPFVRASSFHIGAAAATAALRDELSSNGRVSAHEVDEAYAVSRITPGTNLLALYAVLGHRLGGWWLSVQAVAVGIGVPASVAILLTVAYTGSSSPAIGAIMRGARAGGAAVLLGAAVRLARPLIAQRTSVGLGIAAGTLAVSLLMHAPVFLVLLASGLIGAVTMKPR